MTTLVLQPGLSIDLLRFVAELGSQSSQYSTDAGHPSFTTSVLDRVLKFLAWVWLAVPSPYLPLALLMSAATLVGLVSFARRHGRVACLAGVLAAVLLMMMVRRPMLNVRQYLMLVPLLAIGFGVGVMTIHDRLRAQVWARGALLVGLALVFFANGRWLYAAAASVGTTTPGSVLAGASADLLRRPHRVRLSPEVYPALAPRLGPGYSCRPGEANAHAKGDEEIAIFAREHVWRANVFGFSRRFHGSREVNYDWYPTWVGRTEHSPILILSPENARAQNLPVDQYGACAPRAVR